MNGLVLASFTKQRFTKPQNIAQALLIATLFTLLALPARAESSQTVEPHQPANSAWSVAARHLQFVLDKIDAAKSAELAQAAALAQKNQQQQERAALIHSARERKLSIDQTLAELGLETPKTCLDYSDPRTLQARKEQWARALDVLNHTHHDELIGWIIGQKRPPQAAWREAELHKNCLLSAIIRDIPTSPYPLRLVLDYAYAFEGEITGPRQLAAVFAQTPSMRRHIFSKITHSGYRNATSQSQIWVRKYRFEGRSFNAVSDHAAERCGLERSQTWKPGFTSHARCWFENLSAEEREREILQASSAPGISRHHWATEFDFFSLNTQNFIENARHHGDYLWMQDNALSFGFFQPYQGIASNHGQSGYMEERWHWSYLPISQALYRFVQQNDTRVEAALFAQWDEIEARSNRGRREPATFFPFVRANWRAYMFHVDAPRLERSPEHESVRRN